MKRTMLRESLAILFASSAVLCSTGHTQTPSQRALYQITSGTYLKMGGLYGVLRMPLPNSAQAFVALALDAPEGGAELTFLGQDQRTVYQTLTNGVVSGSLVQFHYQVDHPIYPDISRPAMVDYVVTNQNPTLAINGAIRVIDPLCCDIPYYFAHTNLAAIALPELAIRISEVELCWGAASNVLYQVQYRSDLTTNQWTNLGGPLAGDGATLCIAEKVLAGQAQRYYRIAPADRGQAAVLILGGAR